MNPTKILIVLVACLVALSCAGNALRNTVLTPADGSQFTLANGCYTLQVTCCDPDGHEAVMSPIHSTTCSGSVSATPAAVGGNCDRYNLEYCPANPATTDCSVTTVCSCEDGTDTYTYLLN